MKKNSIYSFLILYEFLFSFAISSLQLNENSETFLNASSNSYTYYKYTVNKTSTVYFIIEGQTPDDKNTIYFSADCWGSCSSSTIPGQGGYCYYLSAKQFNYYQFNFEVTCNIYMGIYISNNYKGQIIKTISYPIFNLTYNSEVFIDSPHPKVSINRFVRVDVPKNVAPGTIYFMLEGVSELDSAFMIITGTCLCGYENFPSSCKSTPTSRYAFYQNTLTNDCIFSIKLSIYSYSSGFYFKSKYSENIELMNNTNYMIDFLSSNASYSHMRFFYHLVPANTLPSSLYIILKAKDILDTAILYYSDNCSCSSTSKTEFPGMSTSCYSSGETQKIMKDSYFESPCRITIGINVKSMRQPFDLIAINKPHTKLKAEEELLIGDLDSNFFFSKFYLYYTYEINNYDERSFYAILEGKHPSDLAKIYAVYDKSSCKYSNFPTSCISSSNSYDQFSKIQINMEFPTKIVLGVYVYSILGGFTLKIIDKNPVSILNKTASAIYPLSLNYNYKDYMVFFHYNTQYSNAMSITLKGLTSNDLGRFYVNYDCVGSCIYRSFPNSAQYCYYSDSSQLNSNFFYLGDSCKVYIGVTVVNLNKGFELTVEDFPKISLHNGDKYLIESSIDAVPYYRPFYFNYKQKMGSGLVKLILTGLSVKDYGSIYTSGVALCGYYYEYPTSSYYCYYSSRLNSKTEHSFNIQQIKDTNFSISAYIQSYSMGSYFEFYFFQNCLSYVSNYCLECEVTSDSNSSKCVKCQERYILDENNMCQSCSNMPGYFFDNTCKRCLDNCVKCTSVDMCDICIEGYIFDFDKKKCVCDTNATLGCLSCHIDLVDNVTKICDSCLQGYYLDNNNNCVDISKDTRFNITQKISADRDKIFIIWLSESEIPENIYFGIQKYVPNATVLKIDMICNSRYQNLSSIQFNKNSTSTWVFLTLEELVDCGFTSLDNNMWIGSIIYYSLDDSVGYSTNLKIFVESNNQETYLSLYDQASTTDGTFMNFVETQNISAYVSQKFSYYGERIQISWQQINANYNYYYSIQGYSTLNQKLIIKNTCNTKYSNISLINFKANESSNQFAVNLTISDFINCGFKNINNGNRWEGIIVYYNLTTGEAYYETISIIVIYENNQTILSIAKNMNEEIQLIYSDFQVESLSLKGIILFFSSSDYLNQQTATFDNATQNYFKLQIVGNVANYNLTIQNISLSNDYRIYDLNFLGMNILNYSLNAIYFALNFSQVMPGTYNLFIVYHAFANSLRRLNTVVNNHKNNSLNENITNSSNIWITINPVSLNLNDSEIIKGNNAEKLKCIVMIFLALLINIVYL